METLTVGLWATNIEPPAASPAAWAALVETRMAEAQAAGAELLVLPEFACAQWLGFAPVGLPLDQQVPWLATLDLDLVLVPAKTDLLSGYYRVFGCAKARAIELQTVVCAVGAVGSPLGDPVLDTVVGGAAAFIPCEASLGYTGVAAALEPHAASAGLSPVLYAYQLPVGLCRRLRHGDAEAEVWPGAWAADGVTIVDPDQQV